MWQPSLAPVVELARHGCVNISFHLGFVELLLARLRCLAAESYPCLLHRRSQEVVQPIDYLSDRHDKSVHAIALALGGQEPETTTRHPCVESLM